MVGLGWSYHGAILLTMLICYHGVLSEDESLGEALEEEQFMKLKNAPQDGMMAAEELQEEVPPTPPSVTTTKNPMGIHHDRPVNKHPHQHVHKVPVGARRRQGGIDVTKLQEEVRKLRKDVRMLREENIRLAMQLRHEVITPKREMLKVRKKRQQGAPKENGS